MKTIIVFLLAVFCLSCAHPRYVQRPNANSVYQQKAKYKTPYHFQISGACKTKHSFR
jgi:hypothetical protein